MVKVWQISCYLNALFLIVRDFRSYILVPNICVDRVLEQVYTSSSHIILMGPLKTLFLFSSLRLRLLVAY